MVILRKPAAVEKLRRAHKNILKNGGRIGTQPRVIEFVYNNACNFRCEHCSTRAALGGDSPELMAMEKIGEIADQAHELGIYELNLHGGELLIRPDDVFTLLQAVRPERFYTFLTTNGYLMTKDLARQLAETGVDRVSVSLDSLDADTHDRFRGVSGAHARALAALDHLSQAGIQPYVNVTVGHYNALSADLEALCAYSAERGYITFFNIAIPSGCWQGRFEVMIDETDRARLIELRKKYKNVLRDLWNPFDRNHEKSLGCQTMSKLYVTDQGDVTPCSFIHIKLGNLYEQPLREIMDYGYRVKYFREHHETCLAGENRWFVEKFMLKEMSVLKPAEARAIFGPEDYVHDPD